MTLFAPRPAPSVCDLAIKFSFSCCLIPTAVMVSYYAAGYNEKDIKNICTRNGIFVKDKI